MAKPAKFDIMNYVEEYMEEREVTEPTQDVYGVLEQKERDLMFAAELGKALLANNEELRVKNEEIMSDFHHAMSELEQEKHTLKLKLDIVANDYEVQVRELQSDIISLREELKKQKKTVTERDTERSSVIKELKLQNERLNMELGATVESEADLSSKVTQLQSQVANKRCSMHEHLHQVEALRNEMNDLNDRKRELERRLGDLTTERDRLLSRLHESQEEMTLMNRKSEVQAATIAHQQEEISQLEETASMLQEKVETLSLQTSRPGSVLSSSMTSGVENSLFAELNESAAARPGNLPLNAAGQPWHPLDEDEDIEVDDEVLMMSGAFQFALPDKLVAGGEELRPGSQDRAESPESDFLRELHAEVMDVYSQLRTMCLELSSDISKPTKPGKTPDKLALVEMDFRLGSLRYVLGELKGLLHDLVHYHSNLATPERFGSGAHQFVANLQEQVAHTESQMILEKADLSKLSDEIEMYEKLIGTGEERVAQLQQKAAEGST